MKRACVVCLALSALVLGCSDGPTPITQIGVTVDSDLKVPSEINLLTIDVSGITQPMSARNVLDEDHDLPGTLTIVRDGGPIGPIAVRAAGLLKGVKVVERTVYVSFKPNSTKSVVIELKRVCANVFCEDGATCDRGKCVPIDEVGSDMGSGGMTGMAGRSGMSGMSGGGNGGSGGKGSGGRGGSGGILGQSGIGSGGITGSGGILGQSGIGSGGITGSGGMQANRPPSCSILSPSAGASFDVGDSINFWALCSDPDGGAISYSWDSNLDGTFGDTRRFSLSSLQVGTHSIEVCATDSSADKLMGCSNPISVTVGMPSPPTATIRSVTQGSGTLPPPFVVGSTLNFDGVGTGKNLSYAWHDSFVGDFATTAFATIDAPEIGRHESTFSVTDGYGRSDSSAPFTFLVLPTGQSTLAQAFTSVNSTLSGGVSALAVDSTSHVLVGDSTANLYRFDATSLSATPESLLTSPALPAPVRALYLSEGANSLYIGTNAGLVNCTYMPGAALSACVTFTSTTAMNGDLPDNQLNAIARFADSGNVEQLALGTKKGVWLTTTLSGFMNMMTTGSVILADKEITGLVGLNHVLWITTAKDGLYSYDPVAGGSPALHDAGAPSPKLSSIAPDALGQLWLGSFDSGFARFDPAAANNAWQAFTTVDTQLLSDHVQSLATARVTIGSTRDVVWVGTDSGVSRYDSTTQTFMNLGMSDGLPSDDVRAIALLPNGDKLFGTGAGIATYVGK